MKKFVQNTFGVSQSRAGTHTVVAKLIHWAFIAVFAFVLSKQVDEVEELEDLALLQEEMFFASVFLLLLLARYIYMHSTQPTVLPRDTPKRMMWLAQVVHQGMYVSLALLALSGLGIGGMYWSGVKDGTFFEVVLLSHEIVFWVSVNLILAHIVGAIYHRFMGDGVWDSMMPRWKREAEE